MNCGLEKHRTGAVGSQWGSPSNFSGPEYADHDDDDDDVGGDDDDDDLNFPP